MEAVGSSGDGSELVVDAFDESVGEFELDVGEDSVAVFFDGSGCSFEWFQLGASSP